MYPPDIIAKAWRLIFEQIALDIKGVVEVLLLQRDPKTICAGEFVKLMIACDTVDW